MNAGAHRSEYERRMHRVVEYIDRNLDRSLELDELAGVAHFSAFHFHRLFSAWMGETLGDYLRRRRLEMAAMRLLAQPRLPVLRVALGVGFGSAEAFARAFKLRFGLSPSAWRAQESKPDQAQRKPDQAVPGTIANNGVSRSSPETSMNVTLVDRPPVTVAYLRHVGPFGEPLQRFWMGPVASWMATEGLFGRPRYGISLDDPGITAAAQLRYDACVEVPADYEPTSPALKTTIPGGRYAVHAFRGPVADISGAWAAMLRDWIPGSGYQLDARPLFEHYPVSAGYDPATGVFSCEICIPVATL